MKLSVRRGEVRLLHQLPPKSIALDGAVQGPEIDTELERYSFDHHDKCLRFATTATCRQVHDALLLGLNPDGFTVFVNDVDGDTALSVWLLMHPDKAKDPMVQSLVNNVAGMDAHGPAYPTNKAIIRHFYEVAMGPERHARDDKSYFTLDLEELLLSCTDNISRLLTGELPLPNNFAGSGESEYKILHTGEGGWVMVEADSYGIFETLYRDGYNKAVVCQHLPDGSYKYTVAKKSDFVSDFPVGPVSNEHSILFFLNNMEPGWGGGSTIGGSPRNPDGSSSSLVPDRVFHFVEQQIKNARTCCKPRS